jgi:hypothetical protein
MPVEIRELIIKTEISTNTSNRLTGAKDKNLDRLKKQILEECKRIISSAAKKNISRR